MRSNRIKLPIVISAFLLLVLSPDLLAQALVMSPQQQWIPQLVRVTKESALDFTKESQINLIRPESKITSEHVRFSGKVQLQGLSPEFSTQQFKLELKLQAAHLVAKNLSIHIALHKDIGFGSATLNLNIQCEAIEISLKQPQSIQAALDRNFQVKELATLFSEDTFETSLVGCTQIAGLDQALQEKVLLFVREQIISKQLHQIISDEFGKYLQRKISGRGTFRVDEQFRLWTTLGETEPAFTPDEIAAIADNKMTSMLVRKSTVEKQIQSQLNAEILKHPILSKDNKDLQKLTCSRWAQFFAWPSLMALPKCFNLKITSEVQDVKLADLSTMNFSFSLKSWALAPDQRKNIAFFFTRGQVSLIQQNSRINDLSGKQFPEFLQWAQRSKRISTQMIKTALQNFLNDKLQFFGKSDKALQIFDLVDVQSTQLISPDTLVLKLNKN